MGGVPQPLVEYMPEGEREAKFGEEYKCCTGECSGLLRADVISRNDELVLVGDTLSIECLVEEMVTDG